MSIKILKDKRKYTVKDFIDFLSKFDLDMEVKFGNFNEHNLSFFQGENLIFRLNKRYNDSWSYDTLEILTKTFEETDYTNSNNK